RYEGGCSGGQGWYDLALAVSPNDPDIVFTGGIHTWYSFDGGATFDTVNNTVHCSQKNCKEHCDIDMHVDIHDIKFSTEKDSTVYVCSDGGFFKTEDLGETWMDLSDGLKIGQIYSLGLAEQDKDLVLTGWQDNGINRRKQNNDWDHVRGADGMECIISHSNKDTMYSAKQYGEIYLSDDRGNTWD
ncbi:MAG: hypothetical protein ABEH43_11945, partial [Flavobacteriales bacterium]